MAYIGKNVLKIYLISYPKTFPGKNEMKGTEDIFISGDVDEVMSRQALHQLRCFIVLNIPLRVIAGGVSLDQIY